MSTYPIAPEYDYAITRSLEISDSFSEILATQKFIKTKLASYISLEDVGVSSRFELINALLICIAYHYYQTAVVLSPNRESDRPIAKIHFDSIDLIDRLIFQIKLWTIRCHTNDELSILKSLKGNQREEYKAYCELQKIAASDELMKVCVDSGAFSNEVCSLPENEEYYPQAFQLLNIDPVDFAKKPLKKSLFRRLFS
jgi:hypothetical protein